jgi:hypothetical protein
MSVNDNKIVKNNNNTTTNTALLAAQKMVDGRVVPKTIKRYKLYVNKIKIWFQQNNYEFALPLNPQQVLEFFGSLVVDDKKPSLSGLEVYKSSLKWFYKEQGNVMDALLNQKLSEFFAGYKRRVANMKQKGEMKVFEGKHPLSFRAYCIISSKFSTLKPDKTKEHYHNYNQTIFAWPYLTLQWNLMCRSNTVAKLMLEHISWEGDCMLVNITKHKTDQEGVKSFKRHIYANPFQPSICPILSLAVRIFCTSYPKAYNNNEEEKDMKVSSKLFEGKKQRDRYCRILRVVLKELSNDEVNEVGVKVNKLGTHSIRKGSTSYCSGMVAGPSPVQIYLRAGWSIGNVQDRYLFNGTGGDQYTGRVISGLPNTTTDFIALPPHFSQDSDKTFSKEFWTAILPEYSKFPTAFREVCIYLLASIVFHYTWLKENFPKTHPLFNTDLFSSNKILSLIPYVTTTSNRIRPTGIPPHLTIANEISEIRNSVVKCKTEILKQFNELPELLTDKILSNVQVNGAVPVTMDSLKTVLDKVMTDMKQTIYSVSNSNSNVNSVSSNYNSTLDISNSVAVQPVMSFQSWMWKGSEEKQAILHMVPEKWTLPIGNIKYIWNLWWFGHIADKIQPLRFLKSNDLMNSAQTTQHSKFKKVMAAIEAIARERRYIQDNERFDKLTKEKCNEIFDKSYEDLLNQILDSKEREGRITQLSIATIYDKLRKRKRKREEENKQNDVEMINTNNIVNNPIVVINNSVESMHVL